MSNVLPVIEMPKKEPEPEPEPDKKIPETGNMDLMDDIIEQSEDKDDIINILSTKVECDKDHCLDGESYINILSNEIEYDNKWGT